MSNGSDYSGLPEDLVKLTKIYNVSDTIIVSNDAEASTVSIPYVLLKEITLRTSIFPSSKFRMKFKMKRLGGTTARAKIYRNNIQIGTTQSTTSTSYVEFSEDITTITDWTNNDKIQIYAMAEGGGTTYISDFRICGIASEFENTKET